MKSLFFLCVSTLVISSISQAQERASEKTTYYLPFSRTLVIDIQSDRAYIGDAKLEQARERCRIAQSEVIGNYPRSYFREGFCDFKMAQVQFPEPPRAYDGAKVEIQILNDVLAKKIAEQYKGSCEEYYAIGYLEEYRKEICEKGEQ